MNAIRTNDVTHWNDLINFKPSSLDVNNAGSRVFGTPSVRRRNMLRTRCRLHLHLYIHTNL